MLIQSFYFTAKYLKNSLENLLHKTGNMFIFNRRIKDYVSLPLALIPFRNPDNSSILEESYPGLEELSASYDDNHLTKYITTFLKNDAKLEHLLGPMFYGLFDAEKTIEAYQIFGMAKNRQLWLKGDYSREEIDDAMELLAMHIDHYVGMDINDKEGSPVMDRSDNRVLSAKLRTNTTYIRTFAWFKPPNYKFLEDQPASLNKLISKEYQ